MRATRVTRKLVGLGLVLAVSVGVLAFVARVGNVPTPTASGTVPATTGTALPAVGPELGSYFIQVKYLGQRKTDADGLPMVAYDGVLRYSPSVIAGEAVGYFSDWVSSGAAASWAIFLRDCDWLVDHQASNGLWLYQFPYAGQPVPWWSAMTQGQALSALTRAYQRTGNPRYQIAAARALQPFTRSQSDDGVALEDVGYTWYEEYLPPQTPHILNGFMFALIGIYEYHQTFRDQLSGSIWDTGFGTLKHVLPSFDTGDWSCYWLGPPTSTPASSLVSARTSPGSVSSPLGACRLASVMYQQIHVTQLRAIYAWTQNEVIGTYADRFARYLQSPPAGVPTTTPGP